MDTIATIIRHIGIVVSVIAIPLALMATFALQGSGYAEPWINTLHIVWAVTNLVTVPMMLIGFISNYQKKWILYPAGIFIALSLLSIGTLLLGLDRGNVGVLATFSLPHILFVIGLLIHQITHSTPRT